MVRVRPLSCARCNRLLLLKIHEIPLRLLRPVVNRRILLLPSHIDDCSFQNHYSKMLIVAFCSTLGELVSVVMLLTRLCHSRLNQTHITSSTLVASLWRLFFLFFRRRRAQSTRRSGAAPVRRLRHFHETADAGKAKGAGRGLLSSTARGERTGVLPRPLRFFLTW